MTEQTTQQRDGARRAPDRGTTSGRDELERPDRQNGQARRDGVPPYDPEGQVDVRGYAGSMATYAALVGTALVAGRAAGRRLPERYSVTDLLVGGLATHKLSRLLAKGSVASPLRAPFTEFEQAAGAAEHQESARHGAGVRHTVGELLTCPFCLGVWLGTGYVAGLGVAPRQARAAAAAFSVVAVSDWLQMLYEVLRRRALGDD